MSKSCKWGSVEDLAREDVIDSRDLVECLESLRSDRDDWLENDGGGEDEQSRTAEDWEREFPDEAELLKAIEEIEDNAPADWRHGETFIRDTYFKDYAMELAEDIGAIYKASTWPNTCIDWDQAARELQMDYTSYEIGDMTYWARS